MRIRLTDFHRLTKPAPMFTWVMAVQHLCETYHSPIRVKSARGRVLVCFGCRCRILPGEKIQGIAGDLREGIAAHVDCTLKLIVKARALDKRNEVDYTERIFAEALAKEPPMRSLVLSGDDAQGITGSHEKSGESC